MKKWITMGILTALLIGMVFMAGCATSPLTPASKNKIVSLLSPTPTNKVVSATARQTDSNHIIVTYQGGRDTATCVGVNWTITDATGSIIDSSLMGTETGLASATPLGIGLQETLSGTVGKDHVVATAYFTDGSAQVILDTTITIMGKIPSSTGSQAVSGGTGPVSTTVPVTVITSSTLTAESRGIAPWSGSWDSEWGTMQFTQSGNQVTATYTYYDGRITGTASGDTLAGTWSQSPSYQPPEDAGDVVFTMADDGNSFTGNWRFGTNTGTWDGAWTATRK
jgi:hypothetical protein